MKKGILSLLLIVFVMISCNKENKKDNVIPNDLAGKKELLKKKKMDLMKLKNEISFLENQIDSLEPGLKKHILVTTIKATKQDFRRYSEIQGVVKSDEITKVSSEIPGRILRVYVDNGNRVKKGQLLVKIDVEGIQNKLEELQKSYDLAKDIYERQERLWKKNIGSEIQFLTAKNNKERLEKGIESLKIQLRKSKIYAPSSGIVDNKQIEEGELASPGFPLMMILNTAKMKVTADVPENYLTSIHKGDKVTVKFPSLNMEATGKIKLIGSTINPTNRTFSIETIFKNHKDQLKPNLLAIVLITDYYLPDAIVVPSELVQYEISGKPFVMIVAKENGLLKARKKYVVTGEEYNGNIVISEGLTENDTLIEKGARSVSANEIIEVSTSK
jgi:RND family efflux transporter MFP subunit